MEEMNFTQTKELLLSVSDAVIASKQLLTEIDSAIGDGDHGIGMEVGFTKVKDVLYSIEETGNVFDLFHKAGKAMLISMGGASGVIFGCMFMAGAKAVDPARMLTSENFADMLEKSLIAIKERGKAQVGDKTMVDALEPAVEALKKQKENGLAYALSAAQAAALEGVENTKKVEAKFGRAKTQASSIGYQDAGATSVWIILKSMADYANRHQ